MREFFHGWRRKAGCATLVMACVLTGVWVRSMKWDDKLSLRVATDYMLIVDTYEFGIGTSWVWDRGGEMISDSLPAGQTVEWTTSDESKRFGFVPSPRSRKLQKQSLFGFSLLRETDGEGTGIQVALVPYYFPSISLTLLSAYLILWKPRMVGAGQSVYRPYQKPHNRR